jgi:GH25 family lysozyme M1 (1,4-beta-N-acetylmuramidase)
MHYRATIAFLALCLLPCSEGHAFPRPGDVEAVRSQLGLNRNRLKSLSETEGLQRGGERILPVLRYDVLNLSEGDPQDQVQEWLKIPGLDAVIHRSSMGVDGSDRAYKSRSSAAARAPYRWGAYHFIRHSGSGTDQAAWFVKTLLNSPNHPKAVLLVLDAEYLRGSHSLHPTVAQIVDCVKRVHELTGVYPGIYTGQDFLREQFNRASYDAEAQDLFENTWLWVARYSASYKSLIFPEVSPPPWDRWRLWQVSDNQNPTPMLEGMRAEMNVFKGERSDLEAFWDDNAWDYHLKAPLNE